jgi:hypothetical protein
LEKKVYIFIKYYTQQQQQPNILVLIRLWEAREEITEAKKRRGKTKGDKKPNPKKEKRQ